MKTLPQELKEAARGRRRVGLDQIYRKVIMPLVPAGASRPWSTLEVTFIYNDFFWALAPDEDRRARCPSRRRLNNLKGHFFVDNNLIAAGAIIVALPTMIVFFALQKQFISGLTLGSTKG